MSNIEKKDWEKTTIEEIATIKGGKRMPKGRILLETETPHPYIKVKNMHGSKIINLDKDFEFVSENDFEKISNYIVKSGDIIISIVGTIGLVALVGETLNNANLTENCVKLINIDNFSTEYLYYYLTSEIGQYEIAKGIVGSTQPKLPIYNIKKISIPRPPLKDQKLIANILSSFDDKIEINNAIIANLEEQAQAIFKSWFVDFEPFQDEEFVDSELGSIPKACKVEYLLDLIEFKGGSQPPKKEHIYEYKDGYVRFIQNRDYNGKNNHLTYIKESKKNRYADRYDILMDKYGEAGKTRYGIEGAYNVALAKIKPNNISLREYIRRFLEQDSVQDYIYNSSMASTRPSVNKKSLSSIKLVIPPKDILKKFDDFSFTIIESILKYRDMNKKLAEIRDTLLPKLMSGEIRVEEAIEVEEM